MRFELTQELTQEKGFAVDEAINIHALRSSNSIAASATKTGFYYPDMVAHCAHSEAKAFLSPPPLHPFLSFSFTENRHHPERVIAFGNKFAPVARDGGHTIGYKEIRGEWWAAQIY